MHSGSDTIIVLINIAVWVVLFGMKSKTVTKYNNEMLNDIINVIESDLTRLPNHEE